MEEGKGCEGCLYFNQYDDDGYGFCDYRHMIAVVTNIQTLRKENNMYYLKICDDSYNKLFAKAEDSDKLKHILETVFNNFNKNNGLTVTVSLDDFLAKEKWD